MKHVVVLAGTLLIALAGLSLGARLAGQTSIEWPLSYSNRLPMPTDAPYDGLFPDNVGPFVRQQFYVAIHPYSDGRTIATGNVQYMRPGDPNIVGIDLNDFASPDVARLAIDPTNWPTYSPKIRRFFGSAQSITYMLTVYIDHSHSNELKYVSGTWNVIMTCNNLQTLLTFANTYPF